MRLSPLPPRRLLRRRRHQFASETTCTATSSAIYYSKPGGTADIYSSTTNPAASCAYTASCRSTPSPSRCYPRDSQAFGSPGACAGCSAVCNHSAARNADRNPADGAAAAYDHAANRPASGIQSPGSAANGGGRATKTSSWPAGTRAADFPASSSGRTDRNSSSTASGRTSPHASNAAVTDRHASFGRWSRLAAARTGSSRKPPRSAGSSPWAKVCSARSKRRPNEGLHSSTADVALQ